MSYTRPPFDAADASWQGASAYTRPAFDAADASFEPVVTSVEAVGAAIIGPVTAAALASHGVAAVGAAVLGPVGAAAQAGHGLSAVGAAFIGPLSAAGVAAHGIAGAGAAVIAPITAAGVALHPRYSLKGEVRDGVLVNRLVRAYRLDTGALVGEQSTTAGRFDIHAGFVQREHYILPLDMSVGATDWLPPTANHVLSELAVD